MWRERRMQRFAECFSELPDPRADNALHDLTEILFIALMATLCGATSCTDMALFARMKAYLWQDVLVLENGLPSHDTFSRVFRMLDPKAFEVAFRRFMKAFAQGAKIKRPRGVIALDGKALRRGYERGKSHMVRPDGAYYQWRKDPPRELSIDLVADERFGRAIGRIEAS